MTQKPERLYLLAQEIAERTSGVLTPLGAGGGNIRSNAFHVGAKKQCEASLWTGLQ
jgi:hypothetical protein